MGHVGSKVGHQAKSSEQSCEHFETFWLDGFEQNFVLMISRVFVHLGHVWSKTGSISLIIDAFVNVLVATFLTCLSWKFIETIALMFLINIIIVVQNSLFNVCPCYLSMLVSVIEPSWSSCFCRPWSISMNVLWVTCNFSSLIKI